MTQIRVHVVVRVHWSLAAIGIVDRFCGTDNRSGGGDTFRCGFRGADNGDKLSDGRCVDTTDTERNAQEHSRY